MAVIKNMMVRAGADFSAITTQASKASKSVKGMSMSFTQSFSSIKKAASGVNRLLGAVGIGLSLYGIVSAAKNAAEAYDQQAEAEMKLATVMRNTMGARNSEIRSILDLCSAQQKLGVIGDEAQIAGAQELATYLSLSSSLKTLIPVMNDMAAQQYGFKVTAENTTSIATMMGKVMEGQTGALRRYGYTFTEAQEAVMKYGTEAERAAMLATVVEESVGGMNRALAQTPTGRMQQLSNTMGDIKEQFGACARSIGVLFLPILWKAADALSAVTAWALRAVNTIGKVFGYSEVLTGWESISTGVTDYGEAWDDVTDAMTEAGEAAKETKKQSMSFDELNILSGDTSTASKASGSNSIPGSQGAAGGLPELLSDVTGGEDGDIPWLTKALTFVKEHLELIKSAALGVGAALLTWKILSGFELGFSKTLGLVLAVAGAVTMASSAIDAWNNGVSLDNVIGMLGGTAVAAAGLGIAFGATGAAVGLLVGGFAALVVGLHDWITTGELSSETFILLEGSIAALGIGFALLLGPIALVAAAVAALALLIYRYWDEISAWFKERVSKASDFFTNVKERLGSSFREFGQSAMQSIRDMGDRIAEYFRSLGNKALSWGKDMIAGLIRGILSKISAVASACSSVGKTIRSYIHFSAPDVGPLKDYERWMPDMMQGLAGGIYRRRSLLKTAAAGVAEDIESALQTSVDPYIAFPRGYTVGQPRRDVTTTGGPENYLNAMGALLERSVAGRESSRPITTIFKVGEREFARATYDAHEAIKKEKGITLISNFA